MNLIKSILIAIVIYSISASLAYAANMTPIRSSKEIETSCRVKSKAIALETYRSCVTDTKTAQLEQVRRQYKVKLLALKAYYENELKKMSGQEAAAAASAPSAAPTAPVAAPATPSSAPAATTSNASDADESAPEVPEPIPVETK